jgi:drug/metabolite transporter (DMT)-like permease
MTQPKLDSRGLMAALCATATWGMVGIFVRWLPGWSPFAVLAGRFLIATAAMCPILLLVPSIRHDLTCSLRREQNWWLSLPVIASSILGTTAFQMAPVGEVTLLFTTSPLFIIAYKYVVRLHIKRGEGFGILIATAGVCLIMLPQLFSNKAASWQTMLGYLFAFSGAGLLAIYTLLFNKLTNQKIAPKPFSVVFITCLLGSIVSLLSTLFFSKLSIGIGIDRQVILILLWLGLVSTALPFFCYTVAAQRLPVVLTTAILLLEPMFAVLFASFALQEIPSLWFGIGSILVLWGLLSIARVGNCC